MEKIHEWSSENGTYCILKGGGKISPLLFSFRKEINGYWEESSDTEDLLIELIKFVLPFTVKAGDIFEFDGYTCLTVGGKITEEKLTTEKRKVLSCSMEKIEFQDIINDNGKIGTESYLYISQFIEGYINGTIRKG